MDLQSWPNRSIDTHPRDINLGSCRLHYRFELAIDLETTHSTASTTCKSSYLLAQCWPPSSTQRQFAKTGPRRAQTKSAKRIQITYAYSSFRYYTDNILVTETQICIHLSNSKEDHNTTHPNLGSLSAKHHQECNAKTTVQQLPFTGPAAGASPPSSR